MKITFDEGDRLTRRETPEPGRKSDDQGPVRPAVPKPEGDNELLKRMKRIDPDQAKKYRQRSGQ